MGLKLSMPLQLDIHNDYGFTRGSFQLTLMSNYSRKQIMTNYYESTVVFWRH